MKRTSGKNNLFEPISFKKDSTTIESDYNALLKEYHLLAQSEKKYRLLVENGGDGIVVVQDDNVKFVNKEMLDLLNLDLKEVDTEKFLNYVHPDDLDSVLVNHENNILTKQRHVHYRIRLLRTDNSVLWVEVKSAAVNWDNRPASLAFIRDISLQKNIEDQLRQTQRMEAIGTLAGGITHDFNNILTTIIGRSELSLLDLEENSEIKESFELIRESGHRARDLVKRILTATREAKPVRAKPLNLSNVVKETLKLIKPVFPSNIKITEDIGGNVRNVVAEPIQLNQIIMNLCTNALHAMEDYDTGTLKVIVNNVDFDKTLASKFLNLEPGPYVELKVSDTGHGIPPEVQTRIFDPYFTTKKQGKGSGFGLATCRGIMQSCCGHIKVDSEVGKGATFCLYFPADKGIMGENGVYQAKKKIIKGTGNILFVDDEKEIVALGQKMLTNAGYSVITAISGKDALAYFKIKKVRIDLMITDMAMPGMTGKRLIEEVLKIKPGLPIILCTGYSEALTEEKAKAIGVNRYIKNPYELIDL